MLDGYRVVQNLGQYFYIREPSGQLPSTASTQNLTSYFVVLLFHQMSFPKLRLRRVNNAKSLRWQQADYRHRVQKYNSTDVV